MVKRPLKLRENVVPEEEAELPVVERVAVEAKSEPEIVKSSQKRRQELGRYWLQVDRQTKHSYRTVEEAEVAGMLIKKKFSKLQVAIYDREESSNRILELPA